MKGNKILGIIFILFFATIVIMYTKNSDLQSQNTLLRQKIINNVPASQKSLDDCLKYVVNYLYMNNYDKYAKLNGKYENFSLYGVRTLDNYNEEKDLSKFRGFTSGVTATYKISDSTSCNVYIIENLTSSNGNMIISDTLKTPIKYYSLYKVGNFFLKIDVNGNTDTISSSDYEKIYRFTSQLRESIQNGINKYASK